jgi:HEAT repeat protein
MTKIVRWSIVGALLVALLALVPSVQAKAVRSEDELIAALSGSNGKEVARAMLELEKNYPTSTKAFPAIKGLLKDPRPEVRRKAARVLGSLHAEVSNDELKLIADLLKSSDKAEVMDGLKALRGLRAHAVVPEIEAMLEFPNDNVKRDACKTLAVVGDKGSIPKIEPLLQFPAPAVQKDAMDAIAALKAK